MSVDREDLIAELSSGLAPVRPPPAPGILSGLWLLLGACFVIAITHWFGPIRATALTQLATEPRFLLETLLGALAIAYTVVTAFRAAIPGAMPRRSALIAVGLMLLWLANYVFGLVSPALEPSMLGKRPHCVFETLLFGLPLACLAFLMSRRLYPLRPVYTAALFGLAAGMVPALYMQIACMYAPAHILSMHILPGLLVALACMLGAYLGLRLRQRQR